MPEVDIILPLFNGGKWVKEAIESVLAQTYADWHLIIIDDASTDNGPEIVEMIRKKQPHKITLISLNENRRAAGARMVGVQHSNGKFVAFIDQDDIWMPKKLELQINRIKKLPIVHAVHTDIQFIDESGKIILKERASKENERRAKTYYDMLECKALAKRLFLCNTIRLSSALVEREAFEKLGGFDITLFGGEDEEFWVRFADKYHVAHIPEVLVKRRIHSKNTGILFRLERRYGSLKMVEKVVANYPYLRPYASMRKSAILREVILLEIQKNRNSDAYQHAQALIKEAPYDLRSYLLMLITFLYPFSKPLSLLDFQIREFFRKIGRW